MAIVRQAMNSGRLTTQVILSPFEAQDASTTTLTIGGTAATLVSSNEVVSVVINESRAQSAPGYFFEVTSEVSAGAQAYVLSYDGEAQNSGNFTFEATAAA